VESESSRLVDLGNSKSEDVRTCVLDGTLSRSIAAGSGRTGAGTGCGDGAAAVRTPDVGRGRTVGRGVDAGRRRAGRAGMGVVEITSTVGKLTGASVEAGV